MAGWFVAWTRDGRPLDQGQWDEAVAAAGRYGETVQTTRFANAAIAVWRRKEGEFPHSGTLFQVSENCHVAWVGQCLADCGDVTSQAIQSLSQRPAQLQRAVELDGPFAAAVIHDNPPSVSIWTDRLPHYPVYLYRKNGISIAATAMRCIIPWLEEPKIDMASVDMMLRAGELIDRMTLLEDVECLPGSLHFHDDGTRQTEQTYWRYEITPDFSLSLDEYANRFARLITSATRRFETVSSRLGVPLSGGLDSRLCLGLCQNPTSVPSFTWGVPGCRDIRFAREFALRVSSPHEVRVWDVAGFVPLWAKGVDLTAGSFGVHGMFVLPYVPLLSRHCDVVLNGLGGDGVLGGNFLKKKWMREKDLRNLAEETWRWRVTPGEDRMVNHLVRRSENDNPSRRRWCDSFCRRSGARPVDRMNGWLVENRVARCTNCGTMLLRSGVESHTIFFDRQVLDLLIRTPVEYKWKHRLYFEIMKRACPPAGEIRWQRSGMPPKWGFWPNLAGLAFQRGVRMACKPLGVDPFPSIHVADPAQWFRAEWLSAAERILLSERTLERGLVNPDALRLLWRRHQEGEDYSKQLGSAIAIEFFARMAVDRERFESIGANHDHL